jgi:hypothetical protein
LEIPGISEETPRVGASALVGRAMNQELGRVGVKVRLTRGSDALESIRHFSEGTTHLQGRNPLQNCRVVEFAEKLRKIGITRPPKEVSA